MPMSPRSREAASVSADQGMCSVGKGAFTGFRHRQSSRVQVPAPASPPTQSRKAEFFNIRQRRSRTRSTPVAANLVPRAASPDNDSGPPLSAESSRARPRRRKKSARYSFPATTWLAMSAVAANRRRLRHRSIGPIPVAARASRRRRCRRRFFARCAQEDWRPSDRAIFAAKSRCGTATQCGIIAGAGGFGGGARGRPTQIRARRFGKSTRRCGRRNA